MRELKFLLILFMLIGILAGCSDDVTRPPIEPTPDVFTVDATATPAVVTVNHFVTFHADGRNGVAPSYRWYERGEWVGVGEEIILFMDQQGFHTLRVVGTDSLGAVAEDSVTVTILPAEVESYTVDATANPMVAHVGDNIRLHADGRGGVRPYQEYYWYLNDQNIGVGEDFNRPATEQGIFTFVVAGYDSLGTAAYDSVTVAVVAPNIIETCLDLDLKVGPNGRDDFEEVNLGQGGESNATIDITCDTSERRLMIFGLHYADGIVSYFTIPDVGLARPSTMRVYLGEVRRLPIVGISLRWTGSPSKSADKCTNWNSVTRICLSTEGPNKSADGLPIIRLGKDGNYTLIE